MNDEPEQDAARSFSLANGRALLVSPDGPDSVRLEEWKTDREPEFSLTLTGGDVDKLSKVLRDVLAAAREGRR
jgi:hypothetical protein